MIEYRDILDVGPEIQERVRLWRNSPRVRRGMLDPSDITVERHRSWLSSLERERGSNKVRVAYENDIPFGVVNLKKIDRHSKNCDWGIYIGEEAFLGRRLGKRLAYDVHRWGFDEEQMHKMYTTVRADNPRALCAYQELGCRVEGVLQKHLLTAEEKWVDIYLVAQFCDEWEINRRKVDIQQ